MNNNISPFTDIYNFKKVIDDIIDVNLINKGIVKYIAAKVVSVNSNGTVNVYIPPDNSNIVNGLANKTGESLVPGDSVELCAKNGSIKNSWIAVKHGISQSGSSDNFPIGSIVGFAGSSVPNNWLIADGSEVSRETYSELFEVIGTYYGEGDGTTTFNLPDRRGKVGVGLLTTDKDFDTLGNVIGEKEHVLTVSEQPHLTGQLQFRDKNGDNIVACYPDLYDSGVFHFQDHAGSQWSVSINNGGTAQRNGLVTFDNGGQNEGHNNMQPSLIINYIIKVSNGTSFVPSTVATVINNLTNTSITDALSANMGKQLNDMISALTQKIEVLQYNLVDNGPEILTGRYYNGSPEYIVRIVVDNLISGSNSVDVPFDVTNINVVEIGGTVVSSFNNIFSLDTANFNGGNNYAYLNDGENRLFVNCNSGNYKTAYVNIRYTKKGE